MPIFVARIMVTESELCLARNRLRTPARREKSPLEKTGVLGELDRIFEIGVLEHLRRKKDRRRRALLKVLRAKRLKAERLRGSLERTEAKIEKISRWLSPDRSLSD